MFLKYFTLSTSDGELIKNTKHPGLCSHHFSSCYFKLIRFIRLGLERVVQKTLKPFIFNEFSLELVQLMESTP